MIQRLRIIMRALVGFSRTETNAFLILLPLLFIIVFSQPIYNQFVQSSPPVADTVQLNQLLATWKDDPVVLSSNSSEKVKPSLFSFNPNTATEQQLKELGFTQFQITGLVKYRAKGGKFSVKSDLLKLYGMDSSFYQRLFPFIELPQTKQSPTEKSVRPERKELIADINTADTTQLKAVYGIGTKLAQRIINYREKLGGFVSMRQLQEVYGLDSAVVKEAKQKFKVEGGFVPKQFNVNTATAIELAKHPYFKKNISKAIETYRFQHGAFTSLDDLVKIQLVTPDDLARIKPYLTLNP
jgi:competence protein ComEA